jgi:hypothetical protein
MDELKAKNELRLEEERRRVEDAKRIKTAPSNRYISTRPATDAVSIIATITAIMMTINMYNINQLLQEMVVDKPERTEWCGDCFMSSGSSRCDNCIVRSGTAFLGCLTLLFCMGH